jgi:hypothetical protein
VGYHCSAPEALTPQILLIPPFAKNAKGGAPRHWCCRRGCFFSESRAQDHRSHGSRRERIGGICSAPCGSLPDEPSHQPAFAMPGRTRWSDKIQPPQNRTTSELDTLIFSPPSALAQHFSAPLSYTMRVAQECIRGSLGGCLVIRGPDCPPTNVTYLPLAGTPIATSLLSVIYGTVRAPA